MDNIKVLVIDDCAGFRRQAIRRLTAMGHECMEAADVETARCLLAANSFSYVILDMQIPDDFGGSPDVGNGHLLLQEIRRNYGSRETLPVIVVSGEIREPQDSVDLVMVNGANDYLTKPLKCTGRTLEESVTKCLNDIKEVRAIAAEQRPLNARPVAEWLRPSAAGGLLTNWDVVGRNGVVHSHVLKSSTVMNTILHCILRNNDKPKGVAHGDFMTACKWDPCEYFKEQGGVFSAKRGRLKNYADRLKSEFFIDRIFTDDGVIFIQPQKLEVQK